MAMGVAVAACALAQPYRIGQQLPELPGGVAGGKPAVVLFVSAKCPVSNTYNQRMIELYKAYSAKVNFVFLNANQNEPAAEVETHARRAGFPFPVGKDKSNVWADRLGAELTPQVFLIDASGALRYRGRIDDAQNPARVKHESLKLAVEAVIEGKGVE
ncbi:MAG: redoxin domain-containing protein, partial [Bryobacteraceae bacterium]